MKKGIGLHKWPSNNTEMYCKVSGFWQVLSTTASNCIACNTFLCSFLKLLWESLPPSHKHGNIRQIYSDREDMNFSMQQYYLLFFNAGRVSPGPLIKRSALLAACQLEYMSQLIDTALPVPQSNGLSLILTRQGWRILYGDWWMTEIGLWSESISLSHSTTIRISGK